ncbi:unnamed protein product [Paramecium sonneborni]|uniref:C2H2-type domain-containing protein n=1 Tax=Paramecium sonneborni TaxID=65129 RepID=A0A8S1KHA4_9CILI|nr:unnamed protein product [Paramecium sonneborni]
MKSQNPIPKVTKNVFIINQKSNIIQDNPNRQNTLSKQENDCELQKQIKSAEIPQELEQKALNNTEEPYQRITLLYQKNSIQLQEYQNQIVELKERIQAIEQKFFNLETTNKKKKKRRTAAEIEKNFECPYKDCQKQYGSDVSLNLHIKFKHNSGSKTEHQKIIRQLQAGELDEKDIQKINISTK